MKQYTVSVTNKFKKDYKRCIKQGKKMQLLDEAIILLKENGSLPQKYNPHKLHGDYAGLWECHIQPDWLLVWKQFNDDFILLLTDTGSHSELFKK